MLIGKTHGNLLVTFSVSSYIYHQQKNHFNIYLLEQNLRPITVFLYKCIIQLSIISVVTALLR